MSLLDDLTLLPEDNVLFVFESSEFTVRKVLDAAKSIREEYGELLGKPIALLSQCPFEAILNLISLDGFCSYIFLVPEIEMVDHIMMTAEEQGQPIEYLVRNKNIEKVGGHECLSPNTCTKWVLCTSGTSGVPKLIEYDLKSLKKSVQGGRRDEFIWGLLYEPLRMAGLQVVLQALNSGCTLCIPKNFDFPSIKKMICNSEINSLSATPSMWRKLLMDGCVRSLPLQNITLGGEIADDSILEALNKAFSHQYIRHIYASTEAGVGFVVKDKRSGFPVSYLENGIGNVELCVDDGELCLRSNDSNQNYFLSGWNLEDQEGWIHTGDLVEVVGDRVNFLGRKNGSINVGGNKVMPEVIEQVLLTLSLIDDVLVYGVENPIVGNLVSADIVCSESDFAFIKNQINVLSKEKLLPFQRPVNIRRVSTLPYNNNGKKIRRSNG